MIIFEAMLKIEDSTQILKFQKLPLFAELKLLIIRGTAAFIQPCYGERASYSFSGVAVKNLDQFTSGSSSAVIVAALLLNFIQTYKKKKKENRQKPAKQWINKSEIYSLISCQGPQIKRNVL